MNIRDFSPTTALLLLVLLQPLPLLAQKTFGRSGEPAASSVEEVAPIADASTLDAESEALDPQDVIDASYYFALGKWKIEQNDYEAGREALERATELNPEDPYAQVELADFHLYRSQLARTLKDRKTHQAEATDRIGKALELAPENLDVLSSYARTHLRVADTQLSSLARSLDAFQKLRDLDPGNLQNLTSLAQLYLWTDRNEEAAEVLRETVSYHPRHRMVLGLLVDTLLDLEAEDEAKEYLTQLVDLDPSDLERVLRLADLQSRSGDHAAAVEALRSVPEDAADDLRIQRLLARELHLAGDHEDALQMIEDLRGDFPTAGPLKRLRVAVLSSLAQYDEAASQMLDLPPTDDADRALQDVLLTARLLERAGRVEKAESVLAEHPADTTDARLRLSVARAEIQERSQDYEAAEKTLRDVIAVLPAKERASLMPLLIEVQAAGGRFDDALQTIADRLPDVDDEAARQTLHLHRLRVLSLAERWDEVVVRARELSAIDDAGLAARALAQLSRGLEEQGDVEQAVAVLGKDLDPLSSDLIESRLFAQRMDVLFRSDRRDQAIQELRPLLENDDPEPFMLGVRLLQSAEEYEQVLEAFADYDLSVLSEGDRVTALFLLGAARERTGDRGASIETFQELLELRPGHASGANYLAYLWAEAGENLEQAKTLIHRAIAVDPDSGAFVDTLGWTYYQLGDVETARMHLEWARRLMRDDPTVAEHLGDVYHRLGDFEQAKTDYSAAVRLMEEDGLGDDEIEPHERVQEKLRALDSSADSQ